MNMYCNDDLFKERSNSTRKNKRFLGNIGDKKAQFVVHICTKTIIGIYYISYQQNTFNEIKRDP